MAVSIAVARNAGDDGTQVTIDIPDADVVDHSDAQVLNVGKQALGRLISKHHSKAQADAQITAANAAKVEPMAAVPARK